MIAAAIAVIGGLLLLIFASDRLVVAAVRLSEALGISAVLIGALVVGLGTSMPEMLVSALASADGEIEIAMANVVGSNIANVTLVLGVAAIISAIVAEMRILRREGVLMLASLLALTAVLYDQEVERWEGGALLFGFVVAVYLLIRWSMNDAETVSLAEAEVKEMVGGEHNVAWEALMGTVTLVLTVLGARLLLGGALDIGEEIGLSDTFLGVMLGVGTSLPELATATAAIRRRESDLVVGNVLGSNLFNSLAVAGLAGVVGPGLLPGLPIPALWVMVGVSVLAGIFARTGTRGRIVRFEGVVLVLIFLGFTVLAF